MTWVWLVALATAGTLGHLLYTKTIQLAEVSQMQPIEFIRLPMVARWLFLFGEVPTYWTWLGGAIIFAATAYVTSRSKAFPEVNIYTLLFHLRPLFQTVVFNRFFLAPYLLFLQTLLYRLRD